MNQHKTNRRGFIRNTTMAATLPLISCGSGTLKHLSDPDYGRLDEILKQPVFRKELFP